MLRSRSRIASAPMPARNMRPAMSCSSRYSISVSVSRGLIDSSCLMRCVGARLAAVSVAAGLVDDLLRAAPGSRSAACRSARRTRPRCVSCSASVSASRRSKYSLTGLGQRAACLGPDALARAHDRRLRRLEGDVLVDDRAVELLELRARSPALRSAAAAALCSLRAFERLQALGLLGLEALAAPRFRSPVSSSIFSWLARSWRLISRLECPAGSR